MTARRERRRRSSESPVIARLQLTSLIDIFTVLLLFLLKSLVVGGAVVSPFPGVALPPSSSTASFKESRSWSWRRTRSWSTARRSAPPTR